MTSAFSWQNFVSLCPALFCTQSPYPCLLLQVYLDFLFFQSPIIKRLSFFGVSSRSILDSFVDYEGYSVFFLRDSFPIWPLPIYLDSWPNISGSYAILFFIALDFTFTTRHIHIRVLFLFCLSLFIPSGAITLFLPSSILGTYQPGEFISSVSYHFAFSYSLWDSQGKTAEMTFTYT